jgi:hypothetical protein
VAHRREERRALRLVRRLGHRAPASCASLNRRTFSIPRSRLAGSERLQESTSFSANFPTWARATVIAPGDQ